VHDQRIALQGGRARLEVSADPGGPGPRLDLYLASGRPAGTHLTKGELLMAIEALPMVYAELCGARPDSLARGVNRTLRNRTRAARERRRAPATTEEGR